MSAASAITSSWVTCSAKRIPPFRGFLWWLCSTRQPWNIWYWFGPIFTGNWKPNTFLQTLICVSRPSATPVRAAARSNCSETMW